ncbi:MAG: hypothetical protein CMO80_18530 [Verrucomicrobiales bacterium]|nr:hypothetical protein [Verrucomicrobiales bacterium]|tara:strand:+ start:19167 stop:20864 length:1698 start_codon:yes stop_codon:yes gene_type:complete
MSNERDKANAGSTSLEKRVRALRRRMMSVAAGTGGATAGLALIGLLMLGMFADWSLELPWFARLVWLGLTIYTVCHILREQVIRRVLNAPDVDEAALMLERAFPKFCSRLISALQLSRPGAVYPGEAHVFVQLLVKQTEAEAEEVEFTSIVNPQPMRDRTAGLLCLIGISGILYGFGGDTTAALLKRSLLSGVQIPRDTMVENTTGDLIVGRGDSLVIQAEATGIIPAEGLVIVDYESSADREFTMVKAENSATYTRRLESVQESFNYVVYLNDGRSKVHKVRVLARPTVAGMKARQQFPEYTGFPETPRSLADLSLLSGSRLKLTIEANKPVSKGYIQLHGSTNRVPLIAGMENSKELEGVIGIPATNLTGFSIHTVDEHDLVSQDEAIYRVDVLADRAPQVRITYPERREELITPTARMLIAFEATDDFGIGAVQLAYRIDRGETNRIDLELEGKTDRLVKRRYDWKIADIQPAVQEGMAIEYWIEVRDNNNVTGPGISATERNVARVVSPEEKRQDLMNRVGDSLSSIDEAASDQKSLNDRLGELIRSRAEVQFGPQEQPDE